MIGPFYQDRVFVLRPSSKANRAGEAVLDYAGVADLPGFPRDLVQVRPVTQGEVAGDDRRTDVSEWLLQTQPGSGDWDVSSIDWIRLPDGQVVEVIGDPARPSDPLSGLLSHVQVRARRARG